MSKRIPTSVKYNVISTLLDVVKVAGVLLLIAAAAVTLFYHVSNQVKITRLGYQIAEVTAEHRRLLEENKKLTIEAAVQGRSQRMADVAIEEFGLSPVRPEQIRKLPKSLLEAEIAKERATDGAAPDGTSTMTTDD